MKADWDRLGSEFAGSSSVLIGDVDCTEESSDGGKPLCDEQGVQGFPTIKYFMDGATGAEDGEDYQGGRDLDSLRAHVREELEVQCLVVSGAGGEGGDGDSGCTPKQVDYIAKMRAKTGEERAKQLERLDGMKGKTMAAPLKQWLMQRIAVLRQFDVAEEVQDESDNRDEF